VGIAHHFDLTFVIPERFPVPRFHEDKFVGYQEFLSSWIPAYDMRE
jgi:hypothetical protein